MASLKKSKLGIIFAAVIIVAIAALAGWSIYASQNNQEAVDQPKPKVLGQDCPDRSTAGSVVFYYKEGTSQERIDEVIKSVNGSIDRTYGSLHGYAIKVSDGDEEAAVATLKTYPEVTSADVSRINCAM